MTLTAMDQMAVKHGTDKCLSGHGYTNAYHEILGWRRHHPIAILEIGVYDGGSIRLWRDYFSLAKIVGVDVDSARIHRAWDTMKNKKGVELIDGDVMTEPVIAEIENAAPAYHLIIDDASHKGVDVIKTFMRLWPLVAPGGYYVIEDLYEAVNPSMNRGCLEQTGFANPWEFCLGRARMTQGHFDSRDPFYKTRIVEDIVSPGLYSVTVANKIAIFQKANNVVANLAKDQGMSLGDWVAKVRGGELRDPKEEGY